MAWPWKKSDPLQARARALNSELAALEAQIRDLSTKAGPQPRLRSTTHPGTVSKPVPPGHVFEKVDHMRAQGLEEPQTTPAHYNSLGVRKYDLLAAWQGFMRHFRGPPASNPKLVSYLAAGNIQGLRPLRYEKRVARNRLLVLAAILVAVLWGIIYEVARR